MASQAMNNRIIELSLENQGEPVKDLSVQEEKRLEQLENVVAENFKTFVRVGMALAEIRDRKLYRMKARTFEKYCSDFFDLARRRAYQIMGAASVIENVKNFTQIDDGNVLDMAPMNEAQASSLAGLRPEQQFLVWKAAVETAPNGKMTAKHVSKVVKQYIGEKIERTVRRTQEKVSQKASVEFTEAFEQLSQQIIKERNSNYKYTSRGEIIKALDQLRGNLAEDGDLIEDTVFRGGSDDANKLERAGFSMFRMDRSSMTIKQRNENGGWVKYSGGYETLKAMEAAFKEILLDDMHLVG